MKTIKELRNEGLISTRLYNNLLRAMLSDDKFTLVNKALKRVDTPNANELTVKDIFELWTEEEIMRWRGMGQSTFEELKGLI